MTRDTLKALLGYGLLAAGLLASLYLVSLAPLAIDWGRELVAAAIAIVAVLVGLAVATRVRSPAASAAGATTPTAATPRIAALADTDATPAVDDLGGAHPVESLSPRERDVLVLLARGLSNKELARELGVSGNTVKTHLASVYGKLGARRRTEAVAVARRLRLVE